ncbi:hypothetical protein EN45_068450 [Penicillium chrysogenum]|uniref:Uncharacterized protein n=1 Tax=Penicillium chrysogenum TaxID=5076 RepID=A0A167THA5_PENCH|nr:hypothetical protein EN45_068450 [Penicillium chrysogenum]
MVEATSFPSLPSHPSISHFCLGSTYGSTYYTRGSSHPAKVDPNGFLGFQTRDKPHNPSFLRTLGCSRPEVLNHCPYLLHLGFFPESSIWNLLLHPLQPSLSGAVLHHTDILNLTYLSLVRSFSLLTFANLRKRSLSMETSTTLRRCVGVELQGEEFVNELFKNTLTPPSTLKLQDSVRIGQMKESGLVFFGSPFSGLAEGQRLCSNLMRVPPDDPQIPSAKVQDPTAVLADGVCGSATWGEGHRVLGVFRYAPATGRYKDYCFECRCFLHLCQ